MLVLAYQLLEHWIELVFRKRLKRVAIELVGRWHPSQECLVLLTVFLKSNLLTTSNFLSLVLKHFRVYSWYNFIFGKRKTRLRSEFLRESTLLIEMVEVQPLGFELINLTFKHASLVEVAQHPVVISDS